MCCLSYGHSKQPVQVTARRSKPIVLAKHLVPTACGRVHQPRRVLDVVGDAHQSADALSLQTFHHKDAPTVKTKHKVHEMVIAFLFTVVAYVVFLVPMVHVY